MRGVRYSFADAAAKLLADAGKPLHVSDITRLALERNLITTEGKTPSATMQAILSVAIRKRGAASRFVRVRPGTYGLREWDPDAAAIPPTPDEEYQVRVPHFPKYTSLPGFIDALEGVQRDAVTRLRSAIYEERGSPQATVDWSEPDTWIEDRLDGEHRELARRIWEKSGRRVNPRHTTGHWLLATNYDLLCPDTEGVLHITARGRGVIDDPSGDVVQEIDEREGLLKLLSLIADSGRIATGDLREPWRDFLSEVSKVRSDSYARSTLWARLRNLRDRGFVDTSGRQNTLTDEGLAYLASTGYTDTVGPDTGDLWKLVREQQASVRESLRELLLAMDPFAFERLIKDLLEAMGYEEVEVTSPGGDGGVDVIGHIQLGITSVKEVIQAKKHAKNIQRHVLDALRGSLHRFEAVRGTIVSTGDFASGTKKAAFEPGAAPITLINGDKLIDLLIEHEIGVRKRTLEIWDLDAAPFEATAEDTEERAET